ncbi:hypothetical protein M408DRAFT_135152 [Serendipita vermifera MAFF 305830]|uniref:Uncharacterized protein n=1 Tax=Serendipita vermifera MAFF 305830 TaxID=933852 RepID=A0A0C3B9V3_SERVB|nr:hypothetical protein M408DRAFT_135152 [Serendipita vermifera MAFF 305830]
MIRKTTTRTWLTGRNSLCFSFTSVAPSLRRQDPKSCHFCIRQSHRRIHLKMTSSRISQFHAYTIAQKQHFPPR